MKSILFVAISYALLAVATAQAQRVEFQRQKFDRSRFNRPNPSEPLAPSAPSTPSSSAFATPAAPPSPTVRDEFAPAPQRTADTFAPAPATSPSTYPPPPPQGDYPVFSADAPYLPNRPFPDQNVLPPEEQALVDQPLLEDLPKGWFDAKEFPEALELQKKTGACILIYFRNPGASSDEKGRISWFETGTLTESKFRKALRYFIKVRVDMPGGEATHALVTRYNVTKTPSVNIQMPGGGRAGRMMIFETKPTGKGLQLIKIDAVMDNLRSSCTPAYQSLF